MNQTPDSIFMNIGSQIKAGGGGKLEKMFLLPSWMPVPVSYKEDK